MTPTAFVLDVAEGIAFNHHHNFHEYGCKVIQQTVQEVAQSEFAGFPRRPDYLHDYQTMTTKTPKPQNPKTSNLFLGYWVLGDAYGGKLRTSTTATIAYTSFRVTFHSQHHTHAENRTHYPTRDLSGALWK